MTYVINNYNGTPLVSIADRTVNTDATSLKLPGRDYPRYGEPIVEDLVWMLQNFAGTTAPLHPINGQIWYDSTNKKIKIYDATTLVWLDTGLPSFGTSPPSIPVNGQLWFDSATKQLKVWDSTLWRVIGPLGSANSTDPTTLGAVTYTALDAMKAVDNTSTSHDVLRITVGGTVLGVWSEDSFVCGASAIPGSGLTTVVKGLNLANSAQFAGTISNATTASNALAFQSLGLSSFYLTNQTNLPSADNSWNLGSGTFRYANVYAVNFQGIATSALYADLAERYHSNQPLDEGTVVELGGEHEITPTTSMGSTDVFGVISLKPAFAMNAQAGDDVTWPYVALVGRVPVKVQGTVNKGQRLMSSNIPGVAQAWNPESGFLAIIGRSLENKTTQNITLVLMVVGTR